jgi:ABC-2 type transport system ATP-binding protein
MSNMLYIYQDESNNVGLIFDQFLGVFMINVTGLTKIYGNNKAVEDLTFNAEKGEILGFLGPNGAGKTTTMRILTSYLPPTSGKVTIGGYDVIENSLEARKLIGYLPETVPLYPDMRVSDYLKFMAQLHHAPNSDVKVRKILAKVGMEERAHSFIHKLSKGMRQRIGLAQALIHDPDVLILDEPTIGLDPAQIKEVRDLIKEIGKDHTVLLSTHILSEAQQMCDRVLIINRGHIVAEDSPEHLQLRLSGSSKVTIKITGEPEKALAVISKVNSIINPVICDKNTLQFENPADNDLRSKVVRELIKNGIELMEIFSETVNLEEIFLQLTGDDQNINGFSSHTVSETSHKNRKGS